MDIYLFIICIVILATEDIIFLICHRRRYEKRLKEIEDQLVSEQEESESMLREMLGNITHDLKTPLTAIRGYSQGILDGVAATPERMNKYVTTIRNKADDMAGLVDELSLFAQIHKKDIEYKRSEVEVNNYISRCMGNLALDLETRHIDFLYRNDVEKGTFLFIDEEKVKRVFYNIVGNARKYIDKDAGRMYIRVEGGEHVIWIHIQDNGTGIEESELPFIFDRFYRTDSSRNSKTGGTGLGLAIAKKVIEDHGGEIYAESEKGKGTKISFSLPKKVDE